jgi:hypothetical protein
MSPKQSGPGVGLISIVNAFSLCSGRRDEARRIALNIAKLQAVKAAAVLDAPLTNVVASHRTGAFSLSLLRWLFLPVHPWL